MPPVSIQRDIHGGELKDTYLCTYLACLHKYIYTLGYTRQLGFLLEQQHAFSIRSIPSLSVYWPIILIKVILLL